MCYTVLAMCQSLFSASYKHINIETHYNPPLFSGTRRQDQAKVYEGKPRVRAGEARQWKPCQVVWSQVPRGWRRCARRRAGTDSFGISHLSLNGRKCITPRTWGARLVHLLPLVWTSGSNGSGLDGPVQACGQWNGNAGPRPGWVRICLCRDQSLTFN